MGILQQKDECSLCMNGTTGCALKLDNWEDMDFLERDYLMCTEVGQLGGYGFLGAIFGVDGSCKDSKMGSGCCKFQEEMANKCARVGREKAKKKRARVRTGRSWEELF